MTVVHKGAVLKRAQKTAQSNLLPDVILGGQDGLVNVLGVILGVAAASNETRIVVAGGLAATFAESISMAAVAFTSKAAQREHYLAELEKEKRAVIERPEEERAAVRQIYQDRGFSGRVLDDIVDHVSQNRDTWVDVMMKDELELRETKQREIYRSSWIVGGAALIGSFIPLTPFFFLPIKVALFYSLGISALALFIMGVFRAKLTVGRPAKTGMQMLIIGMTSALAGYLIGLFFSRL